MDRPMGPRTQPTRHNEFERGNAAYESVFGRPSATHHQTQQPPVQYGQPAYPYPAANGQYNAQLDRRTSYASSIAPSMRSSPHAPPNPYGQSSYYAYQPPPPQPYQQPYSPQPPSNYSNYSYPNPNNLSAPSVASRARSVGRSPGVVVPTPEEPPDPSLEALTRQGLTPAQAYQAHIYMKTPMGQSQSKLDSRPADRRSAPNGLPQIPLDLQPDDGKLGLNFLGDGSAQTNGYSELSYNQQQGHSQPDSVRSRLSAASTFAPIPEQPVASSSSRPYPLQLDTAVNNTRTSGVSTSPASSTAVDHSPSGYYSTPPTSSAPSGRRSSESSRTLPGHLSKRDRTAQDRSRSMSAALTPQVRAMLENGRVPRPPIPNLPPGMRDSTGSNRPHPRRPIVVNPALLSKVAQAFKDRIQLSDKIKDGLTYKDAFDGREAVDRIAFIIKTTDRNLALLLGRALDAQKFFHAVTYDHRLRDSANDLYQFRLKMPSPFASGELADADGESLGDAVAKAAAALAGESKESPTQSIESGEKGQRDGSPSPPDSVVSPATRPRAGSITSDDVPLPTGVFTLLTDCYSPTCSKDRLCYSIACPRRLEQQARLNMKLQPGLKKQISKESLGDLVEPGTLWIHSVPQTIVDSVSDSEKKRQEAINEVIYTERDFVRDMEYLRDLWIKPLRERDIIPEPRRTDFLEQVFWNIHDIIAVNTRLRDALNKRQKQYAIVERIGDILLDAVPHFGPFVSYGAHQLYGKYEFEKEKSMNPAFAQFVEETERRPESRKLELNGYLTKPTTRLARYPLLLEAVLKHTHEDNPDKKELPKVVEMIRGFLKSVNAETGKAENRFNLLQLEQQLVTRDGDKLDLRLQEEGRELVYKGPLKKRGGGQSDNAELLVFLFDHALLMVKQKSRSELYKAYRPPIPLELLLVSAPDDSPTTQKSSKQKALLKNMPHTPVVPIKETKGGFSITFVRLGREYYEITLWASTYISQRKWVEHITKQQDLMRERSLIFETLTLNEGFFIGSNRVNCAAPFEHGQRLVYGTADGVYMSNLMEYNREPMKVLALLDVTQIDVLEHYGLLIVLSERQVVTIPLDALDPMDPMGGLKRAKRIASHISFFKAGICLGKTLVCVVKTSALSSTIKVLEPIETTVRGARRPTFKKLLQGGNDTLRLFKEFYIPVQSSSIHFLKTRLCVGCTNGFEIVDLETLDTQGLLDPADQSLNFARKKEELRPMAIYRIDNEFLLCYDEFAFYVDKAGHWSRKQFKIHWEGRPTGFALHYPYVLAFEPTFVEIYDVNTGQISQIIQGNNLRLLFADTPPSTTNTANAANTMYYDPYQTAYAPNQYGSPQASIYNGRTSVQGGHPHPNPYQPRGPSTGRDEIVMVSDDRVMRVQLSRRMSQQ